MLSAGKALHDHPSSFDALAVACEECEINNTPAPSGAVQDPGAVAESVPPWMLRVSDKDQKDVLHIQPGDRVITVVPVQATMDRLIPIGTRAVVTYVWPTEHLRDRVRNFLFIFGYRTVI